jgi:hypothetical protein
MATSFDHLPYMATVIAMLALTLQVYGPMTILTIPSLSNQGLDTRSPLHHAPSYGLQKTRQK